MLELKTKIFKTTFVQPYILKRAFSSVFAEPNFLWTSNFGKWWWNSKNSHGYLLWNLRIFLYRGFVITISVALYTNTGENYKAHRTLLSKKWIISRMNNWKKLWTSISEKFIFKEILILFLEIKYIQCKGGLF